MARTGPVISRRLFLALGIIMLSAIMAGIASIVGLNKLQNSFDSVNTTELPTLTSTAHISRISAAIAERGAMLVVAPNSWTRISELEKVNDNAEWLEEILENISSSVLSPERRDRLLTLKDRLIGSYRNLDDLVGSRIVHDQKIQEINNEIHNLQEDLVAFQFAINLPAGAFVPSGALQQWIELANSILIELSTSAFAIHPSPLDRSHREISGKMDEVIRQTQFLPNEAHILGGSIMERMEKIINGEEGLFAVKKRQLAIEMKISGHIKQIQSNAEQFTSASEGVVRDIRTSISGKGEKISSDMRITINVVLALVLIASLISIMTFVYINRTVLSRLGSLRRSMLTHAEGENEPIDTSGNDEISEMANSLEYFVSAIHTREESMRDARDEAENANVAKTKFLAAASHDLRQPLQALNLFVFALAGRENDPEKKEILGLIQNSLDSLKELLNTLLDISKLEAGVVQPHIRTFPVASVLDRISSEMSAVAWKHDLNIRCVPCSANIESDPLLMETIIRNLLDNAIKYSEKGKVLLGCRRKGDSIRIEVWDSGPGIDESEAGLIFNDFYQINNEARQRSQGLGLGLSIVRRLARLLGHEINFSSIPGKGTCFWISVPLADGSGANEESREIATSLKGSGEYIAIIEDDESVAVGMTKLLRDSGYDTIHLEKIETSKLQKWRPNERKPDLIVADYRLDAGLTGGEAIEMVRNRINLKIPAIIVTGDTAPERLREAKKSGFEILHKPIRPDEFLSIVRKTLSHQSGH